MPFDFLLLANSDLTYNKYLLLIHAKEARKKKDEVD